MEVNSESVKRTEARKWLDLFAMQSSKRDPGACYHSVGRTWSNLCFLSLSLRFLGSIIRCMRRLEELLRQMCQAAKAIGNTELENKFAFGIYSFPLITNILHQKLDFMYS